LELNRFLKAVCGTRSSLDEIYMERSWNIAHTVLFDDCSSRRLS